jgi:hypothetical protein
MASTATTKATKDSSSTSQLLKRAKDQASITIKNEKTEDSSPGFDVLDQVDSEDIPELDNNTPFIQTLLLRMRPGACLQPAVSACTDNALYKSCLATDREELDWILPGILHDIGADSSSKGKRTEALRQLHRLMDREHQSNRYECGWVANAL